MRAIVRWLTSSIACLLASACAQLPRAERALDVRYRLTVQPNASSVRVEATVRGLEEAPIDAWQRGWIDPFAAPAVHWDGGVASYAYDVTVSQSSLAKADRPALAATWFAAFGKRLFALPEFRGELERIEVELDLPADWAVFTSRGRGRAGLAFPTLADLHESMLCLGDYRGDEFDVGGSGASTPPTRFVVMVRGASPIEDDALFDGIRRIVDGQSAYFGRAHPVAHAAIALHFYTDVTPDIPGFNALRSDASMIVGLHPSTVDARNPELFGMLAHEGLHTWIPGALRNELGPWFNEGLNDYVAYGALRSCGVHDAAQHLAFLDKWTREYRWLAEHDRTSGAMPYRRGMIAAWIFDVELRRATNGERGLRDVLIALLDRADEGRATSRSDFIASLRDVGGRDFAALFHELVEADATIDLEKHLAGSGFGLSQDGAHVVVEPVHEVRTR